MANVLTVPQSGSIYFDSSSAGGSTVPNLSAGGVSIGFDGCAGLNVTSYASASADRFSVDGESGRLFSVNDALTGTIFSVNDASGLPIIEVNSDATTDTIAIGEYGTNALFVSAGYVGVGTATPTSTLDVAGDISVTGNVLSGGCNLESLFISTGGAMDLTSAQTVTGVKDFCTNICVGGNIYHTCDSNTSIAFTDDVITLCVGGENVAQFGTGGTVINNDSLPNDFIVRGDSQASLFYVDASADRIGVGNSSPGHKVDVRSAGAEDGIAVTASDGCLRFKVRTSNSSTGGGYLSLFDSSTNDDVRISAEGDSYFNGGDVGIGTTSPSGKLNVIGSGTIGWSNLANSYFLAGTTSAGIGIDTNEIAVKGEPLYIGTIDAGDDLVFRAGGSATRAVIDGSNGYFGIGTASPNYPLHVYSGAVNTGIYLQSTDTDAIIAFADSNVTSSSYPPYVGGRGDDLIFGCGANIYQYIDTSTGNVGIGCTTPGQTLTVAGSALFTGDATVQGNLCVLGDFTCMETTVTVTSAMDITNHGTGPALCVNQTGSNDIVNFLDDGTSVFYIEDGGNVGIGCTNPGAKLQVKGDGNIITATRGTFTVSTCMTSGTHTIQSYGKPFNVGTCDDKTLSLLTNNTSRVYILSSGEVGIGTTTPAQKLHVGSGHLQLDNTYKIQWGGTNARIDGSDSGDYLRFWTSDTERIRITTGGDVGIGTAAPSEKLEVVGNILLSDTSTGDGVVSSNVNVVLNADADSNSGNTYRNVIFQNRGTETARIDASGNLGIGTTSPGAKLEVNSGGGIHISDDSSGRTLIIKPSLDGATHEFTSDNTVAGYAFCNNTSELVRINSGGCVGIGTSPEGLLQISKSASTAYDGTNDSGQSNIGASLTITNPDTTTNSFAQVNMQVSANSNRAVGRIVTIAKGSASSDMAFVTENAGVRAEKVRINSSGDVGIGTSAPGEKLTVSGNISASNDIYVGGCDIYGDSTNTQLRLSNAGGSQLIYGSSVLNNGGALTFSCNGTERFRVNANGSVGIGTSSPDAKLHVASGDVLLSNNYFYEAESTLGTNYKLAGLTSGNVIQVGAIDYTSASTVFAGGDNISVTTGGASGSTRMYINSSGNVGIGTTSPGSKLTVAGALSSNGSATATCFIKSGGASSEFLKADGSTDSNTYLTTAGCAANSALLDSLDSSQFLRSDTGDSASGCIGFSGGVVIDGTNTVACGLKLRRFNSDAEKLDISLDDSYTYFTRTNDESTSYMRFCIVNTDTESGGGAAANCGYMEFVQSNTATCLTINSNRVLTTADEGSGNGLDADTVDGIHASSFLRSDAADTANCIITFCNGINLVNGNVRLSRDGNKMYIGAYDGWRFYDTQSSADRMCLTTGGNLGIGCTTPGQTLTVAGDGLFTSDLTVNGSLSVIGDFTYLDTTVTVTSAMDITNTGTGPALVVNQTGSNDIINFKDDGTSVFYIEDGGNVGIGTTDPVAKLHVNHASDAGTYARFSRGTTNLDFDLGASYAEITSTVKPFRVGTSDAQSFHLVSNDSNRLTILSGGYVGIGTATPSEPLEVVGTARMDNGITEGTHYVGDNVQHWGDGGTGLYFPANDTIDLQTASTSRIRINSSGNVGIGCTSPTCKLDVCGTILANSGGGAALYGSHVDLGDNQCIRIGAADDLRLQHNGTSSYIQNTTGDLRIEQYQTDGDIIFYSDNGSGGIEQYFRVDGGTRYTTFERPVIFNYDTRLTLGGNTELQIFNNNTDSHICTNAGNLVFTNTLDDKSIIFRTDNGSGGVTTYLTIDGLYEVVLFNKDATFGDNVKANFGDNNDLQIYHTGTDSYIKDSGTGGIKIDTDYLAIRNAVGNETQAKFLEDGAVELYYDNSKKLETTSTGATVTGTLSASSCVYVGDKPAVSSDDISYIVKLTQSEYDAITPDPATLYIITDESTSSPVINPINTVTANYTVTDLDYTVLTNGSSLICVTLPSASANSNYIYNVKNISNCGVIVNTTAGNIDGSSTYNICQRYENITVQSDGSNWYII